MSREANSLGEVISDGYLGLGEWKTAVRFLARKELEVVT
jgi:hypothetical protein